MSVHVYLLHNLTVACNFVRSLLIPKEIWSSRYESQENTQSVNIVIGERWEGHRVQQDGEETPPSAGLERQALRESLWVGVMETHAKETAPLPDLEVKMLFMVFRGHS